MKGNNILPLTSRGVVLIAIDGSPHSTSAFNWYLKHAHFRRNTLMLEFVTHSTPTMSAVAAGVPLPNSYFQQLEEDSKRQIEELKSRFVPELERRGVNFEFHSQPAERDIGYHLCERAKAVDAFLIVMGSRGLGTVQRALMSSVSNYVLHHAHCPVAIIRDEADTHQ